MDKYATQLNEYFESNYFLDDLEDEQDQMIKFLESMVFEETFIPTIGTFKLTYLTERQRDVIIAILKESVEQNVKFENIGEEIEEKDDEINELEETIMDLNVKIEELEAKIEKMENENDF